MPLSGYTREKKKEQKNDELASTTVRGGSITANLFVFPHYMAEVDWVFL